MRRKGGDNVCMACVHTHVYCVKKQNNRHCHVQSTYIFSYNIVDASKLAVCVVHVHIHTKYTIILQALHLFV